MDAPDQLTIVRAGRLVDVAGARVVPDQAVLIRADRIERVVRLPQAAAEAGRVIDLSRHTLLPGLIDVHTHLIGQVETGQGYASLIDRTAEEEMRAGVDNARATLLAGFTTVRDVGTFRAFLDVNLRGAIDRGEVAGPRMACAGA
jgi:imidazolonepropionase-like amidohydrolase